MSKTITVTLTHEEYNELTFAMADRWNILEANGRINRMALLDRSWNKISTEWTNPGESDD